MNLRGLKPAVSPSFRRYAFGILLDVFLHSCIVPGANSLGKVAVRPEAISPEELLQFRKLRSQGSACAPFQMLDGFCQWDARLDLQHQVDMVRHDLQFLDPPPVHLCRLIEQVLQADGYLAFKDPLAVFREPDEVVEQTVLRMGAGPMLEGHTESISRLRFTLAAEAAG